MFERFLERLSKSEYQDKFVIKGGMLISAIVGLDTRITMDLDTTLRRLALTEEKVKETVNKICNIDLEDDVSTGDVITPDAVEYEFGSIMNDNLKIKLWGYSIETVPAEKMEKKWRQS